MESEIGIRVMKSWWLMLALVLAGLLLPSCGKQAKNFPPDNAGVRLDSTNLPIVWIEVGGDSIMRSERIQAHMKIIHNGEGRLNYADTVAHPGQHIDYDGLISLRHRGNSTYNESPKKPYSFRTLQEPLKHGGKKVAISLLDMNRDNNWALLAPYADKSMMRDLLCYEIARPWMEFVPEGRYCELILDGTYYGVYILCEVVSKGRYRLDLQKPKDSGDALTGDYLMEVDCNDDVTYMSKFHPIANDGTPLKDYCIQFQYKSPDYDKLSKQQRRYIQNRIDQMEAALASADFRNPATGYRQYIDVQSFIDYQLVMEACHNIDAYRLSGKFYKRRDSEDPRFKMVVWDANQAFGNCNIREGWRNDTWVYLSNDVMYQEGEKYLMPFWWQRLNEDPDYTSVLKARWAEYRNSNLREDRIMATIDSLATVLTSCGAEQRNSQAWPRWGVWVWPNKYVATDFADEVAHRKQWLLERLAWMDEQLGLETPEDRFSQLKTEN